MKKLLILTTILSLGWLTLLAFSQAEPQNKEYITLLYNDFHNEFSMSSSNGTFERFKLEKKYESGDQSQILEKISLLEKEGYQLLEYEFDTNANNSSKVVVSALMSK